MEDQLKQQRFYGWRTLIGIMAVYAGLCGTVSYAYGVFLPSMGETFHWSRSALSGPYGFFYIVGGLLGPVVGLSIGQFGPKKNIIYSNILAALGLIGLSQVTALWHVYLFYGFMGGLGIAFGEFIPMTTIITNWFNQKRSMAMGLLFASGGIGGFVLPPLISLLISEVGWRSAWIFLGCLHFLLTVFPGVILIRNQPEEMNQTPDGIPQAAATEEEKQAAGIRKYFQASMDWEVKDALRTRAFWVILLLFSIPLIASAMLTTHQVAYLQDLGFSPFMSATALGLMIGTSIVGRLASGFLGMKFEGRLLAAFFLALMGLGILSLIMARGIFFVYLYSVLTGIGFGGMIVLVPNLVSAYFGRKHYSRIIGWGAPVITLLSAGSPSLAGMVYDATGSYKIPFFISAGFVFWGIILAFLLQPPKILKVDRVVSVR